MVDPVIGNNRKTMLDTDNVTAASGESSFNIVNAVLSAKPISMAQAMAAVESDTAGAVVSFSGVVRNHDAGKLVERLSYSAHPTAQEVMADVIRQVVADYIGEDHCELVRIWAAHRLGMLEIGDPALVCAVSASHRGQAFELCSELVDRIKAQVPIWKEQFFSDGSIEWVGATA